MMGWALRSSARRASPVPCKGRRPLRTLGRPSGSRYFVVRAFWFLDLLVQEPWLEGGGLGKRLGIRRKGWGLG